MRFTSENNPRRKLVEPVVKADTPDGARNLGVQWADIDWTGGYRAAPSQEAAEGVVRPYVTAQYVGRAANAYTQRFLHRLARAR